MDYRKEYREALDAGNRALQSLQSAKSSLDSAENWGILDMLGGGLLSGLMKRSKIEDAQELMDLACRDLQSFSKELGDIRSSGQLNIELNDFIGYADILWDSFLTDWVMQDRISHTREQLEEVIDRVEQILRRMKFEET